MKNMFIFTKLLRWIILLFVDWFYIVFILFVHIIKQLQTKNIDQIIQESISNLSQKYNDNNFTILITHQPISLEKLKNYPIDLEVAGHTHHGQIFWLRKLTEIVNDYWYWKYEETWKTAIVTQWIWTRGLPFRLGTQSEMVIINLKKKN